MVMPCASALSLASSAPAACAGKNANVEKSAAVPSSRAERRPIKPSTLCDLVGGTMPLWPHAFNPLARALNAEVCKKASLPCDNWAGPASPLEPGIGSRHGYLSHFRAGHLVRGDRS